MVTVAMPLTTYRITLLVTHADGEDETRVVHQEGWNANDAIIKAEQRALADDDVAEARAIDVH